MVGRLVGGGASGANGSTTKQIFWRVFAKHDIGRHVVGEATVDEQSIVDSNRREVRNQSGAGHQMSRGKAIARGVEYDFLAGFEIDRDDGKPNSAAVEAVEVDQLLQSSMERGTVVYAGPLRAAGGQGEIAGLE